MVNLWEASAWTQIPVEGTSIRHSQRSKTSREGKSCDFTAVTFMHKGV